MKKNVVALFQIITISMAFNACTKKEDPVPLITYADVKTIFLTNCTPCHLPGGINPNKWDDYSTAKSKISNILDRIQRDPTATGFMPYKKGASISAAEIAKLKQWQTDGLLEK